MQSRVAGGVAPIPEPAMTEEQGNPVLEYMRRFDRAIGEMREDLHDLRDHVASIETQV
jgi:hypothetical protein